MFGSDPEAAGGGLIALLVVGAYILYSLANDHVVHDKISNIYNRIIKKQPF
ncbi:hypothetical protein [Dehalobacter sp. TeCB1]|uniref:hypothetical protein n=1 Tax=Dehalobacter sp. TeCB1 TaxID=1843715 RepID=UPI00159F2C6F|nr:hypothetical protein [Dehalobacter sp. TeCB1]